jgi:molecular chaperone GrpE
MSNGNDAKRRVESDPDERLTGSKGAPNSTADRPEDVEEAAGAVPAESREPTRLGEALERMHALETEVAERDEEITRLRDGLLRERAELDNFKRRMTREKAEALRFASEPLIRDLLPVLDNLERAVAAAAADPSPSHGEGGPASDALRSGVELVVRQLLDVLARAGVTRINAANQPFDPKEHEALAHLVTTMVEAGRVMQEHLPGYKLHDRLLRPAQVTVAKDPRAGEEN